MKSRSSTFFGVVSFFFFIVLSENIRKILNMHGVELFENEMTEVT